MSATLVGSVASTVTAIATATATVTGDDDDDDGIQFSVQLCYRIAFVDQ